MAPLPISLGTIPVAAFLAALYSGQVGRGVVFALLIFVPFVWFFHRGDDFPPEYDFDLLINWFFASLLGAIVGSMMTMMFHWHPIMDGAHLSRFYRKDKKVSFRKIGVLLGKLVLVFLVFAGSHIIFELHVGGFPKPWGGVVATIGIILGWILFVFLFRRETELFMNPPVGSTGYHKFTRSEVMVYALFAALGHVLYFTGWWLSEFFWNPATWIVDQWYFYMSLILFGGIGLIMWIIAYFLIRNRADLREKYNQVPSDAERPATLPAASTVSRRVNASPPTQNFGTQMRPVAAGTPMYSNPL